MSHLVGLNVQLPGVLCFWANVIFLEDDRYLFNYTNQMHNVYSLQVNICNE
jgi:hypothetical protein